MIFNLGSINADYFYAVPHIVKAGETLAATDMTKGLGGKGANQSVAMIRAGAGVRHVGAVGADGDWLLDRLTALGVSVDFVDRTKVASGHAIIVVDDAGENAITLFSGSNKAISESYIKSALANIGSDDWLVLQNETNGGAYAAKLAKAAGARVAYSAAPFQIAAIDQLLPHIDLLAVNEGESQDLMDAKGVSCPADLNIPMVLRTLGSKGADLWSDGKQVKVDGLSVDVKDTTAAGDTFFGFFLGQLEDGADHALKIANAAAALKVTKSGTADAIPNLDQVMDFITSQTAQQNPKVP
ncbi:MAG: PfkB family carbohydrate kinase [Planktomarina sp.]